MTSRLYSYKSQEKNVSISYKNRKKLCDKCDGDITLYSYKKS